MGMISLARHSLMKDSILIFSYILLIGYYGNSSSIPAEKLRELAWNGVPHYMRPDVWRLLLVRSRTFISKHIQC